MQDACLQQNYFILSSCVVPNQAAPENNTCYCGAGSQQNSSYLFKALFSCCRRAECCFCSWAHSTVLMHLNHLLNLLEEPFMSWCALLPFFLSAQNRFYLSGFPRANASFLQEYTVLISANQMFFPPTFLKKFVCLTCFLHVQYARILNHTRQMWKLQVWTAGLFWGFFQSSFQGNFQGFFVVQTVVLDVQTFQDRLRKSLFSLWGEYVLNIFY